VSKFILKIQGEKTTSNWNKMNDKSASFIKLLLLIPTRSPKEILEKSKFFKKRQASTGKSNSKQSYTQALTQQSYA